MHGDRYDPCLEKVFSGKADNAYPVGSGLDVFFLMHEIIVQTEKDIDLLMTHFKGEGSVKADAIGLTGFSMGGFAAFYIAATNPNIEAVVPIAGIPAFEARWKDVVLEASTYPEWSSKMETVRSETESRTSFIQGIDPFGKMVAYYPKPLLMISGDIDTDSPKKYSVDLYRKLKPVYRDYAERLQLRIYDGVGHQLTSTMIQDACDWFERFLRY
jgi:pimeloyl-ACP methyl ester carboxylesterase